MIKKLVYFLSILFAFYIFLPAPAISRENPVTVHFFRSEGCPHCAKEEIFLEKIKDKYENLIIRDYEISRNKDNLNLLVKVGEALYADTSGIPFTVVGDR